MDPVTTLLRSPLLILSGPILILFLITLFWVRAGSIYSLLERVWRLIAGKGEVSDTTLREFIQETRDIEKFRFMYGLKVGTIGELHNLLEGLRKNSIDIAVAQRARRWINAKSAELVSSPPKYYQLIKSITLLICALALMVFVEVANSQLALLQMKESETWFLANSKMVKGVMSDWVIEKTECLEDVNKIRKDSGFTESEKIAVCDAFKNDTLNQLASDTVKIQKTFSTLFGVGALIWIVIIFFQMTSAESAIQIKRAVTNTKVQSKNRTVPAGPRDNPAKRRVKPKEDPSQKI